MPAPYSIVGRGSGFLLTYGGVDLLATIVDLGRFANVLEVHLHSLLSELLQSRRLLRILLCAPGGAVGKDTFIHAENERAVIGPHRLAHGSDRNRESGADCFVELAKTRRG